MKYTSFIIILIGLFFLSACQNKEINDLPVQIYPGVYKDACLTYADGDESKLADCGEIRDTVLIITPEDLRFVTITNATGNDCPACESVIFFYDLEIENTCAKFEQVCTTKVFMFKPDNNNIFQQEYHPDYRMKVGNDTKRFGGGNIHWLMPMVDEKPLNTDGLYEYTYLGAPNCKGKSIESTNAAWTQIDDFSSIGIDFPKQGEKFEDNLPFFKEYFSHFELHMRYAVSK